MNELETFASYRPDVVQLTEAQTDELWRRITADPSPAPQRRLVPDLVLVDNGIAPRTSQRRIRHRPVIAAAAIAVVSVGGLAIVLQARTGSAPVLPTEPPAAAPGSTAATTPFQAGDAAALVRNAATTTSSALDGSGRITVNDTTTYSEEPTIVHARTLLFAGDDWDLTTSQSPTDGAPGRTAVTRYVGGSTFVQLVGRDGVRTWMQDPDDVGVEQPLPLITNPATLFDVLDPSAHFTVAGEETVDGETLTHLVATTPSDVAGSTLGASGMGIVGPPNGSGATTTLNDIHVWIGANDLIRQLRVTGASSWNAVDLTGEAVIRTETFDTTVVFADYGASFDIETPTDVQIVDSNG